MSAVPTASGVESELVQDDSDTVMVHCNRRKINSVHSPAVLWIGCSDARVPESVMKRSLIRCPRCQIPSPTPGCQCSPPLPRCPQCQVPSQCQCILEFPPEQVFVHRNIANQLHLTDNNSISVLTYGVTGIQGNPIREVRVVGHTDCGGGIKACHKLVRGSNDIPPDSVLWTWLGPLIALATLNRDDSVDELAVKSVRLQMQNVRTALDRLGRTNVEVTGYLYNVGNGISERVPLHPA
jgi:carbonic anhydrase